MSTLRYSNVIACHESIPDTDRICRWRFIEWN